MNEENKKRDYSKWIIWGSLVILFVWIGFMMYTNRNWEQRDSCLNWEDYGENDCTSGMYANCTDLKMSNNAWVKSCLCQDNESINGKIICPEKIKVWRFEE